MKSLLLLVLLSVSLGCSDIATQHVPKKLTTLQIAQFSACGHEVEQALLTNEDIELGIALVIECLHRKGFKKTDLPWFEKFFRLVARVTQGTADPETIRELKLMASQISPQ